LNDRLNHGSLFNGSQKHILDLREMSEKGHCPYIASMRSKRLNNCVQGCKHAHWKLHCSWWCCKLYL